MSAGRESLPGRRADRATAAWLGVGALALYLVTLCPTIFVEDSAEFSTAAAVLGVPHPPGYPLYTMLAGAFVRLVPLGDAGYRSNLFSAACGALAVVALWVLLRRLAIGRLAALAAAICFAVGQTFWSQGLAAEVHTLNALLLVGALLAVHAAAERPATGAFAATGLLVGLLVGHRNLNALLVLGFPLELELARRRAGAPPRLW
ncbi:MAG TPA: DUF2723 domain-containing protein, partial [Polyangia bacterium]|nr:DUF2723 domain-containing protein [Polyangia bacterium]